MQYTGGGVNQGAGEGREGEGEDKLGLDLLGEFEESPWNPLAEEGEAEGSDGEEGAEKGGDLV